MKKLVTIFLLSILVTAIPLTAAAQANCDQVVKDCKSAIEDADKVIKAQDLEIENQNQQIGIYKDGLQKSLALSEAQRNELNSWYRQPEIIAPIAILAGFLLADLLNSRNK